MILEYPDGALGVLVASRAALESNYGEHAIKIMMCVAMIMNAHRLVDLRSFACLQILHVPTADGLLIDVLHRGVGLRARTVNTRGDLVMDLTQLEERDVDRLVVVAVVGTPVIADQVSAR